ncbi:MAG TPA: hypothetical protein PKY96_04765 [Flavobacteriales bacterium]|nr:hypothetical protein [Flavobacteriales bacterium]
MNLKRTPSALRLNLLMAGLSLLLSSALICTPQTVGWMCNTAWVELGFEALPLLEEEVVKHNERCWDHGSALVDAVHGLELRMPGPSDERVFVGPLAQVSVPPPKAC